MAQHYREPERASDKWSLPDVETFYHDHGKRELCWMKEDCISDDEEGDCRGTGWYWRTCLPGCMPDSDPFGPFDTEEEALEDARQ